MPATTPAFSKWGVLSALCLTLPICAAGEGERDAWVKAVKSAEDVGWTYPIKENYTQPGVEGKSALAYLDRFAKTNFGPEYKIEWPENSPIKKDDRIPRLAFLPHLSSLQALLARDGFAVVRDHESKTLRVLPLDTLIGKGEAAQDFLLEDCKDALVKEVDYGRLSYRLATLLAYPEKSGKLMRALAEDENRFVLQYLVFAILRHAGAKLNHIAARNVGDIPSNVEVRKLAFFAAFACAQEKMEPIWKMYMTVENDEAEKGEWARTNFKVPLENYLKSGLAKDELGERHRDVLIRFRRVFASDKEILDLLRANTSLDLDGLLTEEIEANRRKVFREAFEAHVAAAAAPDWKIDSIGAQASLIFKDGPLEMIIKVLGRQLGEIKTVIVDRKVPTIHLDFASSPPLETASCIQTVVARYGLVALLNKKEETITLQRMADAWGEEAKDLVLGALEECASREEDLGKLSYLLASLLAFGDEGHKKLVEYFAYDQNERVPYLSLLIMCFSSKPVAVEDFGLLLLHPNRRIRFAAMLLGTMNADQQELVKTIKGLGESTGRLSKRIRRILADAIFDTQKINIMTKDPDYFIAEMQKVFVEDREILKELGYDK